jgi:hypothetical protein
MPRKPAVPVTEEAFQTNEMQICAVLSPFDGKRVWGAKRRILKVRNLARELHEFEHLAVNGSVVHGSHARV